MSLGKDKTPTVCFCLQDNYNIFFPPLFKLQGPQGPQGPVGFPGPKGPPVSVSSIIHHPSVYLLLLLPSGSSGDAGTFPSCLSGGVWVGGGGDESPLHLFEPFASLKHLKEAPPPKKAGRSLFLHSLQTG